VRNILIPRRYGAIAAIESYDTGKEDGMLDIRFDDDLVVQIVVPKEIVFCDACGKEAFIFQDEGNFCLNCWQERTEPYITVNRISSEG